MSGSTESVCLKYAAGQSLFRSSTPVSILAVLACAMPLYLLGYQAGNVPVVGWVVSFLLGGLAAGIVICREAQRLNDDAIGLVIEHTIKQGALLALVIGGPVIVYSWFVAGALEGASADLMALATNTQAWAWKPVGHVSALAALIICLAPAQSIHNVASVWHNDNEHIFAVDYSRATMVTYALGLALFALIPFIGVLAAPIAGRLVVNLAANATPR